MGFLEYMQAHGSTPGPTQRPYVAGSLCGVIAGIVTAVFLYVTHTWDVITHHSPFPAFLVYTLYAFLTCGTGLIYALLLRRTANDQNGGWLFGLSYGFLTWMIGPAFLYKLLGVNLSVTNAGVPVLIGHLIYGLILGISFPLIHPLFYRRSL